MARLKRKEDTRTVMMELKQEVHDLLWTAFRRWQELRETGVTKHDLKMRGLAQYQCHTVFNGLQTRFRFKIQNIPIIVLQRTPCISLKL